METPKIWMMPPVDPHTGETGPAEQVDATHDEVVKRMVAGWSQVPVDEKGELTEAGKAMIKPPTKPDTLNSPAIPAKGV